MWLLFRVSVVGFGLGFVSLGFAAGRFVDRGFGLAVVGVGLRSRYVWLVALCLRSVIVRLFAW